MAQSDGKLVVAGYNSGSNADFSIMRYNANGSLDTSFDADGKVITAVSSFSDYANSVVMQADGKLVAAGYSYNASGNKNISLVRYNTNGSLDSSFNGNGKIITAVSVASNVANAVVVQSDGKLVIAGYSYNASGNTDFALIRYNTNGSLDTSFDGDGKLTTSLGLVSSFANTVIVQPDKKIVAAGYSYDAQGHTTFAVIRYNANGSLDSSFDTDGKVTTALSAFSDYATSVIMQPDGKLLVAGYSYNATNTADFALVRYNANGSLDTSFDGDGKVITNITSADDYARSVVLQADGKVLVTGTANNDFAIVRYNSNGSLDTTFNGLLNHAPTGFVVINNDTPESGQQLTVTNTLADTDGLGAITYQWKAGTAVLGTGSTYTVTVNEIGKNITAIAHYTDGLGNAESVSSTNTNIVVIASNHLPTGSVTISGDAIQGHVLTASNTLADADGLGTVTYQWLTGATVLGTGSTYTITAAELGKSINVVANYTDSLGHAETVSSAISNLVTNLNFAPTGSVSISGDAIQGHLLTASNTLADADGLGTITYQWKTGTTVLATGLTYTITANEVGKNIIAVANYTDGLGHLESVSSVATNLVAAINHLPTGTVDISGNATAGQVLTAHNNLNVN
jgi:uncharacterized delta-60 repeat protein